MRAKLLLDGVVGMLLHNLFYPSFIISPPPSNPNYRPSAPFDDDGMGLLGFQMDCLIIKPTVIHQATKTSTLI